MLQITHLQQSAFHRNTQDCSCSHAPPARGSTPRCRSSPRRFDSRSLLSCPQPDSGAANAARAKVIAEAVNGALDNEEDLMQYEGREKWYETPFAADDAPDWNPATFVSRSPVATGLQTVTLSVEISREKVPHRNAYVNVGQKASVRVGSGEDRIVAVSSPPFPRKLNEKAFYRLRGDMPAGFVKVVEEIPSVTAEVDLLVDQKDGDDIWNLTEGDLVEFGPFVGNGMNHTKKLMQSFMLYHTIIIFCEGKEGIAAAKSLIEAGNDVGGLALQRRQDVRMYYRAPNEDAFCFKDLFEGWEERYRCKIITSTRDTFQEMFDDDDTLVYEPATTAAVILTGGNAEDEKAALEVCKEGEITEIARQSDELPPTVHLSAVEEFTTFLPGQMGTLYNQNHTEQM